MGFKELMKSATNEATGLIKKEMEKKELERQQAQRISQHISVALTIKSAPSNHSGYHIMRQRPEDSMVYFDSDESQLFELIEYSWDGPIYAFASDSHSTENNSTQTVKKGKSGKVATGAIIGTILAPGIGTAIGAAIGASGKSKSKSQGTTSSTTKTFSQRIEQPRHCCSKITKYWKWKQFYH